MDCLICLEDYALVSQLDAHDECAACLARAALAQPATPVRRARWGVAYRCARCRRRCQPSDVGLVWPRRICLTCAWVAADTAQAA